VEAKLDLKIYDEGEWSAGKMPRSDEKRNEKRNRDRGTIRNKR
jgi:hypothetical protein